MSTLQVRVEQYLGTIADTTALTDQLTAGAKLISDILPKEKLEKYSTDQTDSGSGYSVTGGIPLSAHKSNYEARLIRKEDSARALDSSSIHYATATSPVWYITGGKAYVKPGGGSVNLFAYPTAAYGDSTIANFPTEYEHGVILWTAIQQAIDKLNTSNDALYALSYSAPTPPSAPADASYSYSNAALGTYTSTTIGSLGTAPTYTPPTTTIDGTTWALAYPNYASDIATALTAITTQVGNGVTAQANVASLLTGVTTAINLGNAEVDLAKIEAGKMAAEIALSNTEVDSAATSVSTAVDTATAAIATANGRINTAVGLANAEFDKVPAIVDLANVEFDKIAAKLATASTTISTDEDLEKGLAELQQGISIGNNGETYLKEANERIANGNAYLEEARSSLAEAQGYIGEVNARIQQVQGRLGVADGYSKTSQGYGNVAQSYLGTASGYFTEAQKNIDLAIAYSQSTSTYVNLAQAYFVEVQARLSNVPAKVSEFNVKAQDAFNTFQANLALYQSTTQSAIRQAELDQERLMLSANKTTDLNLQNAVQTLNAAIELYRDKLGKYNAQLNSYGAEVQNASSKYSLDIQKINSQQGYFQSLITSLKLEFDNYLKAIA